MRKLLTPRSVKRYISDLEARLQTIEDAVDVFIQRPSYLAAEEAGFNGQRIRKQIFRDIIKRVRFDAIAETGTWVGDSTGFLSESSGLPVYSCELNARFHALARLRLAQLSDIHLHLADSRKFLQDLTSTLDAGKRVFFYLDAHWYADLPLRQEIEIIAGHWGEHVILIDDFQVPGDTDYGYDAYGSDKQLSLGLIEDLFPKHGLTPFFPTTPGAEESGRRRGCIVLAKGIDVTQHLSDVPLLKPADGFRTAAREP
jgi:hypothetical protein